MSIRIDTQGVDVYGRTALAEIQFMFDNYQLTPDETHILELAAGRLRERFHLTRPRERKRIGTKMRFGEY